MAYRIDATVEAMQAAVRGGGVAMASRVNASRQELPARDYAVLVTRQAERSIDTRIAYDFRPV